MAAPLTRTGPFARGVSLGAIAGVAIGAVWGIVAAVASYPVASWIPVVLYCSVLFGLGGTLLGTAAGALLSAWSRARR